MEKFTIIDGMKARIKELTAELAQLEKALAALQPEAKPKEPKSARLPRDPGDRSSGGRRSTRRTARPAFRGASPERLRTRNAHGEHRRTRCC